MTSARLMRMFPHAGGDGLEDWGPLSAADVKSGSPKQRGRLYCDAPDVGLSAGVWDCTAFEGTMAPYSVDEFMILLEGAVTVTEASGRVTRVEAGEAFVIPRGLTCAWKQDGYVRKIFVIYQNPAAPVPAKPAADHVIKLDLGAKLEPCAGPDPALLNGAEPRCAEHVAYTDASGQLTVGLWSATPYDRKATPFGIRMTKIFFTSAVLRQPSGTPFGTKMVSPAWNAWPLVPPSCKSTWPSRKCISS